MLQENVKGQPGVPVTKPAASSRQRTLHCVLRDNGLSIAFSGFS